MSSIEPIHHYGYANLHWKGMKLYFQEKFLVELIPHKSYPKMYHLKFCWRDVQTEEFFNITWARHNSRQISLYRLNYDVWESTLPASLSDLNVVPATMVA